MQNKAADSSSEVSRGTKMRSHRIVAMSCVLFVTVMVGAAYAAVPLYEMFCRVTGFGGATKVAVTAPDAVSDRIVEIRFDSNVAPGLPWDFSPETRSVQVSVGETKLVYYRVKNQSDQPVTATASYNVTPTQAGYHFAKMQCFCFTDQTLQAGESLDMPVVFFVDPGFLEDPEMVNVRTITLSYTFFPKATPVAASKKISGEAPL